MPKFQGKPRVPAPPATDRVVRTERRTVKPPAKASTAKSASPVKAEPPRSERSARSEAVRDQVVNDAARLVQWGRKWYELPELIARMADRPPLPEVRRILKDNKTAIDKKAGRG
jgi:hypothetical protein